MQEADMRWISFEVWGSVTGSAWIHVRVMLSYVRSASVSRPPATSKAPSESSTDICCIVSSYELCC